MLLSEFNVPAETVGSVLVADALRAPQASASVDVGSKIQYLLRLRSLSACQRAELYNVGACNRGEYEEVRCPFSGLVTMMRDFAETLVVAGPARGSWANGANGLPCMMRLLLTSRLSLGLFY